MEWKKLFQKIAVNAEEHFDKLKNQLQERLGGYGEIMILPYYGFGNTKSIYLKGRVLENKNIKTAESQDSIWENLVASYKRMNSNELPFVKIKVSFQGITQELITDEEGYFTVDISTEDNFIADNHWVEIHFELLEVKDKEGNEIKANAIGKILLLDEQVSYGIISDVDDTILQTKATELTKAIQLTFMRNARTRLPFKGVSAFYQALHQGKEGKEFHPIFYVSSSPWNLYDFLKDFCEVRHIPQGVFFLRDLGISQDKFLQSSHDDHKSAQIERIMQMYPSMQFILIGDSGQHDPEIYLKAIKDYPQRILAVYIRDVSEKERDERVKAIVADAQALGVEMVFTEDTLQAGKHAVKHSFISESALLLIEQDTDYQEHSEFDFPILSKFIRE